jgi:uncharacterized membrane protein
MAMNSGAGETRAAAGKSRALAPPRFSPAGALVALALVLAAVGAGIAGYLAFENVRGQTGVCTVVHGCATVQNSVYGKILGVPVSVPGLALYLALTAGALAWLRGLGGRRDEISLLASAGASFGLLFSGYLTYVEAFVLDAWCIYCIVSASLLTLLTVSWVAVLALALRERRSG